jgi:hypothetical protein
VSFLSTFATLFFFWCLCRTFFIHICSSNVFAVHHWVVSCPHHRSPFCCIPQVKLNNKLLSTASLSMTNLLFNLS